MAILRRGWISVNIPLKQRNAAQPMNGNNITVAKDSSLTERQGQFLAYIHLYNLVNGRAPAESDMREFFQITASSVHSMVVTLERLGLICRVPGQARSITVRVPPESLPPLTRTQPRSHPAATTAASVDP